MQYQMWPEVRGRLRHSETLGNGVSECLQCPRTSVQMRHFTPQRLESCLSCETTLAKLILRNARKPRYLLVTCLLSLVNRVKPCFPGVPFIAFRGNVISLPMSSLEGMSNT